MPTLKEQFERFMSILQGVENIDALMEQCNLPGRQRADYLAFNRRVIIEQKSLEVDPHDKVQAFINDFIRGHGTIGAGQISLASFAQILAQSPDGNDPKKGEYPGLDKRCKRWQRCLGQAGAALCCLISVIAIFPHSEAFAFVEPYKSESGSFIPSEPMLGERISISNFAPKIETFFPFFDRHLIFWRQSRLSFNQNGVLAVRVYDVSWSANYVWDYFKGETIWQRIVIRRHLASSTDIICGCLTAIFHDHLSQKLGGVDVSVICGRPRLASGFSDVLNVSASCGHMSGLLARNHLRWP